MRTVSSAPAGILGWAANRLGSVHEPVGSRFAIDMLFPGAWEQVGMELAEQGLVRVRRTKLRRRPRFSTVATPLRREVVEASRALLFDDVPHDDDACLAVVGATGDGGELLAHTPFTDEAVASAFADREPCALETKVDEAIAYALVPFWANGYYSTGATGG